MKKILILCLLLLVMPFVYAETYVQMNNFTPSSVPSGSQLVSTPAMRMTNNGAGVFFLRDYFINMTGCSENDAVIMGTTASLDTGLLPGVTSSIPGSTGKMNLSKYVFMKPSQNLWIGTYSSSAASCRSTASGYTFPQVYINNTVNMALTSYVGGSTSTYIFNGYVYPGFYVPGANDIVFLFKNEDTGAYLGGEVINISLVGDLGATITDQSVNDGFLYINATADTYETLFSAANYTQRKYIVTVGNSNATTTNVYLLQAASTTTITVTDSATGASLQDVYIMQERSINGTWTLVSSCLTDIAGQCALAYKPSTAYRLTYSKSGYSGLSYTINPITQSTYSVRLTAQSTQNVTQDYDGVSIFYNPSTLRQSYHQFTYIISSPHGLLSAYSYNLQNENNYSIDASGTGSNSYGETFLQYINYSGVPLGTRVFLNITYTKTSGDNNTLRYILTVGNYTNTLIEQGDNVYGLSFFDRMFIAAILLAIIAGIAYFLGGFEAASVVSIFIMGYFMATGFVNVYVGALVIIPIFFVLAWRAQI